MIQPPDSQIQRNKQLIESNFDISKSFFYPDWFAMNKFN